MRKWTRLALLAVIVLALLSPDLARRCAEVVASLFVVAVPFAPYATACAALFAGLVAVRSLRQRSLADDRQEWWKRAEFALTFALDRDDAKANTGLRLLTTLRDEDDTATPADAAMLRDAIDAMLTQLTQRGDDPTRDTPPVGHGAVGAPTGRIARRLAPLRRCFSHDNPGPKAR